jgi:hypothetical protein
MPPTGESMGTVVLRPDPLLVESHHSGFEAMWGGQIEFPGVAVRIER